MKLLSFVIICVLVIYTLLTSQFNHQYDYILEIDATDSVEIFHIYDNHHNPVGSFTSLHPDSLQIIINEDNL